MSDGRLVRPPVRSPLRGVHALEIPRLRRTHMASTGKRKTTMAKLNRERRLLDRRIEKKAKKDARKRAAALDPGGTSDELTQRSDELVDPRDELVDTRDELVDTRDALIGTDQA